MKAIQSFVTLGSEERRKHPGGCNTKVFHSEDSGLVTILFICSTLFRSYYENCTTVKYLVSFTIFNDPVCLRMTELCLGSIIS